MINGKKIPFIHYKIEPRDEIWFPAKPTMKLTGEKNINHILARVLDGCKMSFKDLVDAKGLPQDGCYGFVTPPNPVDHNEGKSIWVNESGWYSMLLGSRKPECVGFQRWVLEEVIPSIRRSGAYMLGGHQSCEQTLQDALAALLEARMAARLEAWMTTRLDALLQQAQVRGSQRVFQNHGVLEIAGARPTSFSQKLFSIGTPVDDGNLAMVAAEGGALQVSVFLQEMGVRHDLIRRLLPTFSAEVARRKLDEYSEVEGSKPPLWIAWSQAAWRLFYTEADRALLCAVFEDPLTKQNLEVLEAGYQAPRADAPTVSRRRSGPYSRVLRGGSSEASARNVQSFFVGSAASALAEA
jgi:prophage antirepressor-like protein